MLERALPPLRPIQEAVKLPLEGSTLAEKSLALLDAVGAGKLGVSDALALLDALVAVAEIVETDESARRKRAVTAAHDKAVAELLGNSRP